MNTLLLYTPTELANSFKLTPQSLRDSSPIKAGEHFRHLVCLAKVTVLIAFVSVCAKSPPLYRPEKGLLLNS